MLDREERVRMKPQRMDKNEEERNEQMKAAVKPKQVVESVDYVFGILYVCRYSCKDFDHC